MELEVNVIKLEDNNDYIIVDALQNNDNKYLFLVSNDDYKKKCIRKVIEKDGEEYLRKLYDEEFEEAVELFNLKHKNGEKINEE